MVRFIYLALTKLHFLHLDCLALSTNDSFFATLYLADWLLKMLSLLNGCHNARLLDFAVESTQQVFERFLGVFTVYLNHRRQYTLTEIISQV